jgi:transposase
LIKEARVLYRDEKLFSEINTAVYAFDSTTIDLCLKLFPWAHAAVYQKTNAAIKVHTLFEVQQKIPTFIRISAAQFHDVNFMDAIPYEPGAFYIFDKGYLDYERLYHIDNEKAFFVIRAKQNMQFTRLESFRVDKETGVRVDQRIKFQGFYSQRNYPDHLRRIKYYDSVHDHSYVYLTNNFVLTPFTIAELYRARWSVEIFFKWIKQHLRIKSFFGTSPNAVKTQVWIAIATYVLVAIMRKKLKIQLSLYTILQILSVSLFEKTLISQLLTEYEPLILTASSDNQLYLFDL